jgi:hypothetical protein
MRKRLLLTAHRREKMIALIVSTCAGIGTPAA